MYSPFCVTVGLVDDGVSMGTFAAWQMGAAARLLELATSPITTNAWSCSMSLLAALAASSGLHWSSSTVRSICLPPTPPAALISSTASFIALVVEMPNVAKRPVLHMYEPSLMGPSPVTWASARPSSGPGVSAAPDGGVTGG